MIDPTSRAFFITLILLILLVAVYTYIALKFSLSTRKRKGLTPYFFAGIIIGAIGGFLIFYNLRIMNDKVYFTVHFEKWILITIASIILGGILSIYIYLKVSKK